MRCDDKKRHATEREALKHLRWAKKQPGGHGTKHLNVYQCPDCGGWHVGRAWRGLREREAAKPKAEPTPKSLTAGQQRRKAEREAEQAKRDAMFADYRDTLRIVAKLVEAEIAKIEAAMGKATR